MHATRCLSRYVWPRKSFYHAAHASALRGRGLRMAHTYPNKVESKLENATTTKKASTVGSVPSSLLSELAKEEWQAGDTRAPLTPSHHNDEDNSACGDPFLAFSPTAEPLPCMTEEDLSEMNIKPDDRPLLKLKSNCEERVAIAMEKAKPDLWFYNRSPDQLSFIQRISFYAGNRVGMLPWITEVFLRAFEMVPKSQEPIFYRIPDIVIKPGGEPNLYIAINANKSDIDPFFPDRNASGRAILIDEFDKPYSFFVLKPTLHYECGPHQMLGEMYDWGKRLGKNVVRGAVTNGRTWTFIILKMNVADDGATYTNSSHIQLMELSDETSPDKPKCSPYMCDLISVIMGHWIEHGDKDIGEDDWFE